MDKFILYRDSKGRVWENCFEKNPTKLTILAKNKSQALKLAYDNIQYDKQRGWGILQDNKWAGKPVDQVNAPTIAIDSSPKLDLPQVELCPCCGQEVS